MKTEILSVSGEFRPDTPQIDVIHQLRVAIARELTKFIVENPHICEFTTTLQYSGKTRAVYQSIYDNHVMSLYLDYKD